jgi:ligand-binding sensor domain-containing protein/serine phosphatase RsbU (regulator of sigma subunit)
MNKPKANSFFIMLMLSFLLISKAIAFESVIRVNFYNIENGLSQSNVTCLHLDSYGFLWVGTQDGLNRYDGYTFKTYRNNPLNDNSISNNSILSIGEDRNGNLWIGTWNGLSVLDRRTDTFKNYYHNSNNPNSLSANRVFKVFVDKDDVVWLKTLESLDSYDSNSDSFIRYPHFSDPFTLYTDINDFDIYEDSKSRFWVGTKDGLLVFDKQIGLFKRFFFDQKDPKSISSNKVKCIVEDRDQNIWIATASGLNRFVSDKEGFVRYINSSSNPFSIPDNRVNTLFVDGKGRLLVGTESGLVWYNNANKEFTKYILYVDGRELDSPSINTIVEDNSSILWVGTQSGLVKWDLKGQKFKFYGKDINGENIFSNNSIASLMLDGGNLLWVGTWGTGLHLYNRTTGRVIKYSQDGSYPYRIVNDYVHTIYKDSKGRILIGTRNGVQLYNPSTKSFSDFFKGFGVDVSQLFAENRVYSINEDKYGNYWFATRLGLHRFNGKGVESFYHNANDSLSITSSEIHCIELDGDHLWVGTFNGLNRINIKSNEISSFQRDALYQQGGLISNDIVSLKLDSRGVLWVGTPSGLHKYDSSSDKFSLLTEVDGLPNNLVYAIEEDQNGDIWVSTNWGLAKVNQSDNSITRFGVSDGLQSYEFNVGASFISSKGELFFGGILGVNAFHPDLILTNTHRPHIVITEVQLISSNGQRSISVVGERSLLIKEEYSLLNIEFSALDFTHPEKNLYMYKMEGLSNDWIDIGSKHSATFSNLSEGTYTFRVKGANSDNVWNDQGVALQIIIQSVFWKSRVAYWLYGLAFILSLILFLRTRTTMLRKTSRLLKEREFSMNEIENQKEALLIQNKSITDSINYAKRIQEALIPSEYHFKKILPDSFILYLPKDIVSGDFYWINETHNKIFVAAIDCTGHGVPGAFMSIIGVELLRNITNLMGLNDAAEILNRLDIGVHDTFAKGIGDENVSVKDGMDVSFCVIDKEQNILQFAGAFSNLYLIRDSKIIEVKGDRFSVGTGGDIENPLFTSHLVTIEPDDMIYMFTDGYVDQFGGPEGKKYKFRRFRHLLLSIYKYPLEIQKKYLLGSINEWKGDHEQVDDILIIGIKPDLSCLF